MDKDTATQHTPGPWNWYEHDKNRASAPVKVETRDRVIADVTWCGVEGGAERIANARLISAAPDLLAALEAVEADYMDRGDCALHTKIGTVIRNALSKAKGE